MNLLSSASVYSVYTLISRVLGYFRDILIAIFLGASIYADAFFVAFRIPNTFRRLFAEGTFNAAFIPSYEAEKNLGKEASKNFANEVFSLLVFILLFIVFLVEIFTPAIVYLISPGFFNDIEKYSLAIELTRITFPFLFFISLASFFSGILNCNNKFAAAAAAPIILNLVLIIILVVSFYLKLNFAKNLSYGVTLSGFLQLIFLIIFCRKYYKPSLILKFKITRKVKFFFKKLLPSIFASGVTQINILVGTIIASFESGAVSYLYYADRVYQINLAIAGIAIGTVSLPVLAKNVKKKKINSINNLQNKSLELCLLLSIPACFGLTIASYEIVNALFGYGSFTSRDAHLTSLALKYFGYGIPAFALIKILSNLFFARDNTKTPFYLSLVNVSLNILISVYYFKEVGFLIIPIATSVSTWVTVFVYLILLSNKKFLSIKKLPFKNFIKIIFSTILMSLVLHYALALFDDKLLYTNNYKFFYVIFVISLVAAIYLISCNLLGVLKIKNYRTN